MKISESLERRLKKLTKEIETWPEWMKKPELPRRNELYESKFINVEESKSGKESEEED